MLEVTKRSNKIVSRSNLIVSSSSHDNLFFFFFFKTSNNRVIHDSNFVTFPSDSCYIEKYHKKFPLY